MREARFDMPPVDEGYGLGKYCYGEYMTNSGSCMGREGRSTRQACEARAEALYLQCLREKEND